ncbi:MAG: UDP-3-O-(3-hydroxymyristoyl)glucosamine N-acyltransferase [Bacteroidia bacterium]|nr:UDP-3-O-(3-hydroxymyristoyl)glucosamine N-acyltransferase [Bacteroidia bacterium]
MQYTAQQLSELLNGRIDGNVNAVVNKLSKIEEAENGSLSFLANKKYIPHIYTTGASIVIVNKDFEPEQNVSTTLIRVDDAYHSFASLLEIYDEVKRNKKGIDKSAHISASAKIGKDVYIGAFAYVGDNAVIENNVKLYPQTFIGDNTTVGHNSTIFQGTKIYNDCVIGSNVTVHSQVVIGADGFGFAPNRGEYKKVAQIGNVIIEDYVEIGSNTCIDRATLGSTIIRNI